MKQSGLEGLTAVILAGGLGTRFTAVTPSQPKVLAPVRNRPFLYYLLTSLMEAGIEYAVLCTGAFGEQVRAAFGDVWGRLHLHYSQESSPLGTAGALRFALPEFRSDPVLVLNGDSWSGVNLQEFWAWHLSKRAQATLLLTRVPSTRRYGRVQLDSRGRVLEFEEKQASDGPGWISGGIYLLSRQFLLTIPANTAVSLERDIFPQWISRGLYGYRSESRFIDIGTPESYARAEEVLFQQEVQEVRTDAFSLKRTRCGGSK